MFELLKSKLGRTHSYVDRSINKLIHLDVVSRSGAFAMNLSRVNINSDLSGYIITRVMMDN